MHITYPRSGNLVIRFDRLSVSIDGVYAAACGAGGVEFAGK